MRDWDLKVRLGRSIETFAPSIRTRSMNALVANQSHRKNFGQIARQTRVEEVVP